jgi:Cu(I)/Ag(I) efflux system membrane fusion protein
MRVLISTGAIIALSLGSLAGAAGQTHPPLYYQDPDGKPLYAAGSAKTPDGRDYMPVFVDSMMAKPIAPPPSKPASSEHRILYYRNPMGLPDTSPVPKKDGMGMDYIPVYADESGHGDPPGTVRISAGRMQTLGVRTEAARWRPDAARSVRATGTVQFDERHLATVTTKVPGWIDHLDVAAVGDSVRRGQVLAEIYAPDLVASEEEYLIAARMGGDIGTASLQRLHALDIPEVEIARLRHTGRAARLIPVMAAADGVIIDKPVQQGMRVDAGQALYKTADLSTVWLVAQVQEQDLGTIQPSQPVHASFVAFPGRSFSGTVDFVYPTLSAETRTGQVRIVLPNPDGALRASMYATVQIDAPIGAGPVLSVPNAAILDTGTRQVVLVARGEGRFEPRQVKLGVHGDDWVQVLGGIKPGEQVVIGANFLIDAESNLRAALQGFADGANPAQGAKP